MSVQRRAFLGLVFASWPAAALEAQGASPSSLAAAKALDNEISNLNKLPEAARAAAIRDLARRIRQQPAEYRVALATNLAISGMDESGDDTLLAIANTLAEALRAAPRRSGDSSYLTLAELVRYGELPTTLDDPNYKAALKKLALDDRHRAGLGFTLPDLRGQSLSLTELKGKVILVVFWATWCPPCRREVPHLIQLQRRFGGKGLEILAITEEEAGIVERFVAEHGIGYRVLLDPGAKVRNQFRVNGFPHTFAYDRRGRLVAHAPASPSMERLRKMLARAGLR